jgi:hypothetical protein
MFRYACVGLGVIFVHVAASPLVPANEGVVPPKIIYRTFELNESTMSVTMKQLEFEGWTLVNSYGAAGGLNGVFARHYIGKPEKLDKNSEKDDKRLVKEELVEQLRGTWNLKCLMQYGQKKAINTDGHSSGVFLDFNGIEFSMKLKDYLQKGQIQYTNQAPDYLEVDLLIAEEGSPFALVQTYTTVRTIMKLDDTKKRLICWSGGTTSDRPVPGLPACDEEDPKNKLKGVPAVSVYDKQR